MTNIVASDEPQQESLPRQCTGAAEPYWWSKFKSFEITEDLSGSFKLTWDMYYSPNSQSCIYLNGSPIGEIHTTTDIIDPKFETFEFDLFVGDMIELWGQSTSYLTGTCLQNYRLNYSVITKETSYLWLLLLAAAALVKSQIDKK